MDHSNVNKLLSHLLYSHLPNGSPFLHNDLQCYIASALPTYTFSIASEAKDIQLKVAASFIGQLKTEQEKVGKLVGDLTSEDIKVDRQLSKAAFALLLSPIGLFTAGHLPFLYLHPLLPIALDYIQAKSLRYRRSLRYCLVALQNEHNVMGKTESVKPSRKLLEQALESYGFVNNGEVGMLRMEWFHRWTLKQTQRRNSRSNSLSSPNLASTPPPMSLGGTLDVMGSDGIADVRERLAVVEKEVEVVREREQARENWNLLGREDFIKRTSHFSSYQFLTKLYQLAYPEFATSIRFEKKGRISPLAFILGPLVSFEKENPYRLLERVHLLQIFETFSIATLQWEGGLTNMTWFGQPGFPVPVTQTINRKETTYHHLESLASDSSVQSKSVANRLSGLFRVVPSKYPTTTSRSLLELSAPSLPTPTPTPTPISTTSSVRTVKTNVSSRTANAIPTSPSQARLASSRPKPWPIRTPKFKFTSLLAGSRRSMASLGVCTSQDVRVVTEVDQDENGSTTCSLDEESHARSLQNTIEILNSPFVDSDWEYVVSNFTKVIKVPTPQLPPFAFYPASSPTHQIPVAAKSPGIDSYYAYAIGCDQGYFIMHVEDRGLPSFNLFAGGDGAKLWWGAPGIAKDKLERAVHHALPSCCRMGECPRECPQTIRHESLFVTPEFLDRNKISYSVIVQTKGMAVLTAGNAYHCGINIGSSLALSSNLDAIPTDRGCFSNGKSVNFMTCAVGASGSL